MLFCIRKKQHFFTANELGVQDMRKVDIEVHVGDAGLASHEQHGHSFHKALHQVLGPGEVAGDLGGMVEYIK